MRALIQRVSKASVVVEDREVGHIGRGYLIFLGVGKEDDKASADRLWGKIHKLRIFEDEEGKINRSLHDVCGEVLVVSQFTLFANCRKGNRPSFVDAGLPAEARQLYHYFISLVKRDIGSVATGEFGAMMEVSLINEGPFTLWLDSDFL